jgi:hypothetical protein
MARGGRVEKVVLKRSGSWKTILILIQYAWADFAGSSYDHLEAGIIPLLPIKQIKMTSERPGHVPAPDDVRGSD